MAKYRPDKLNTVPLINLLQTNTLPPGRVLYANTQPDTLFALRVSVLNRFLPDDTRALVDAGILTITTTEEGYAVEIDSRKPSGNVDNTRQTLEKIASILNPRSDLPNVFIS